MDTRVDSTGAGDLLGFEELLELGAGWEVFGAFLLAGVGDPLWFSGKESHGLNVHVLVKGEAVIDPSRDNNEVTGVAMDADPVGIVLGAEIEETATFDTETDFLVKEKGM